MVIHDQTQSFLNENKILYRFQSGFRKTFSTDSCLSYLNNKIVTGFESGLYTGNREYECGALGDKLNFFSAEDLQQWILDGNIAHLSNICPHRGNFRGT